MSICGYVSCHERRIFADILIPYTDNCWGCDMVPTTLTGLHPAVQQCTIRLVVPHRSKDQILLLDGR